MWSKNFKERFVWRIDRAVLHRDPDAEADVETMTQVDIAQLPTFDRQTLRSAICSNCPMGADVRHKGLPPTRFGVANAL